MNSVAISIPITTCSRFRKELFSVYHTENEKNIKKHDIHTIFFPPPKNSQSVTTDYRAPEIENTRSLWNRAKSARLLRLKEHTKASQQVLRGDIKRMEIMKKNPLAERMLHTKAHSWFWQNKGYCKNADLLQTSLQNQSNSVSDKRRQRFKNVLWLNSHMLKKPDQISKTTDKRNITTDHVRRHVHIEPAIQDINRVRSYQTQC